MNRQGRTAATTLDRWRKAQPEGPREQSRQLEWEKDAGQVTGRMGEKTRPSLPRGARTAPRPHPSHHLHPAHWRIRLAKLALLGGIILVGICLMRSAGTYAAETGSYLVPVMCTLTCLVLLLTGLAITFKADEDATLAY